MTTTEFDLERMVEEIAATLPKASTVLTGALDAIETCGWRRGEDIPTVPRDGEPVTLLDAIRVGRGLAPWEDLDHWEPAVLALCEHLDLRGGAWSLPSLHRWNLYTARSGWEVVTVLRSLTAILREEGR